MPITTPQGTLDFKKVDRVTFVGASSNTVIDTTTGSLGVGVDGNGPTSKLHVVGNTRLEGDINMLHTSNTASIKLNSNVVAEFPRSKKLIKYPRVNLTQNALNNGYAAEASTENNGTSSGQAYRAFDGLANGERGYHSATLYTSGSTYNGTASITDADGTQHQGEWIKLQMPTTEKMKLSGFSFSPRYVSTAEYHHRTPYKGVFLGSTDGIGTNWYPIHYFDNVAGSELTTVSRTFENTTNDYYNHIALVVFEVGPNATYGDVLNFAEMELYGTPEYDPDAHGNDVTVKSYPNVPNTDWLEVYYDAKDLTNISGTIADLSGKSVTGSLNGDVSIDTLNDVKSFSFDGSGDYISGTLTNTGDFDFTVSTWVFETNGTTNNSVWCIGNPGSANPSPAVALGINNAGSLDFFVFGGIEIRFSDFRDTFGINKWHHIVCTRAGTTIKYFINGIDQGRPIANSIPLSIAANSVFTIGVRAGSQLGNNPMHGKIANFRLFNRVLTTDEIYQLYAYQKEDFGHGDLSMTLKAGRLGIGTSEPMAALDVRGRIMREYYPGEVIEELHAVCDRTSLRGKAVIQNVTTHQALSTSYEDVTGSRVEDYIIPKGTTNIVYEYSFHAYFVSNHSISSWRLYYQVNGGGWEEVTKARMSVGGWYYDEKKIARWVFEVGGTENVPFGIMDAKAGDSVDFRWYAREYSSGNQQTLHSTKYWDGSASNQTSQPTIMIKAIA